MAAVASAADAALAAIILASDHNHPSVGPTAHDGPAAEHRQFHPHGRSALAGFPLRRSAIPDSVSSTTRWPAIAVTFAWS